MPKNKESDFPRKTKIPVVEIPGIVEWLISNCSLVEIEFMASLAADHTKFAILDSIFTRLTEYNKHEIFMYKYKDPLDLAGFHSAKRGEVAGLKAFAMACQIAYKEIEKKEIQKKK